MKHDLRPVVTEQRRAVGRLLAVRFDSPYIFSPDCRQNSCECGARMRLADYLAASIEPLALDWVRFIATNSGGALSSSYEQRRDSCQALLLTITCALSPVEPSGPEGATAVGKSLAGAEALYRVAKVHAEERFSQGCTLQEVVAEFHALRAIVVQQWGVQYGYADTTSAQDIIRFSEVIDQALAVAVDCFSEELLRARDLFAGILAHDLRTPLGAIQNSASYLLQDASLSPRARSAAARTERSAARMQLLIGDLLDFTRIRLGRKLPMLLDSVDLLSVAEDVVEEIAATFPDARIETTYGEGLNGYWDGGRIEQLLANLLSNAAQHGDGSVQLAIHKEADRMLIQVRNSGVPIQPDRLEKIFEPLVQEGVGQKESMKMGSIGLGLYIAKAIVVAHQGTICVRSDATNTIFIVDLPLRSSTQSE